MKNNLLKYVILSAVSFTLTVASGALQVQAAVPSAVEDLKLSVKAGQDFYTGEDGVWVTIEGMPYSYGMTNVDWAYVAYPTFNTKPLAGEQLADRPKYQESYIAWGNPFFISKEYVDMYGSNVEVMYKPLDQEENSYILKWGILHLNDDTFYPERANLTLNAVNNEAAAVESAEETVEALETVEVMATGEAISTEEVISKEEAATWKPSTPAEIESSRFAGHEEPVIEKADGARVRVVNTMQGEKCIDSIKAAIGEGEIARTYNIFPEGSSVENPVYTTDTKAKITLKIPDEMKHQDRKFSMVCVGEGGEITMLEDLEPAAADSITFETNRFYAFALIYKDNNEVDKHSDSTVYKDNKEIDRTF